MIVLQTKPSKDDERWDFTVPLAALTRRQNPNAIYGKFIKFTADKITFDIQKFPSNRILYTDDPTKFILCSFGDLRFPDTSLKETGEYISRFMKAGLILNQIQYRFYHHSNSQLRSRSCFLREANDDAALDQRIYKLGDFGRIMNIAKRAKRIGLLFSQAEIDYQLDPRYIRDIPDIKSGDEIFSDGCGLISQRLAMQISKMKQIIFRASRYTPCVFQIRYLGYKGVLMLHPELDRKKEHLAEFRKSMKKFETTANTTFSVVDYSKPYSFGRLNNDIIVLLSSLGVTNDKLLSRQNEYLQWIADASKDPVKAVDFLSTVEQLTLAERVILDGIHDPAVAEGIRRAQLKEIADFKNDRNKNRSRMIIQQSRLLFGVCDPFKVLKEGQVHIRITTARGAATPIHGDVLVTRNPCLHPGDCLKLRAVYCPQLNHLIDCIVFASVARPGHHAAPSMTSGGDLDGDKFFVCWDPAIVPPIVAESYDYPPNREHTSQSISRMDLANHFAFYNNASLARVAALHAKWVRSSPKGALCTECQELNALHSQSVDGASIKIPDRLLNPPEPSEPFILDLLAEAAQEFATQFIQSEPVRTTLTQGVQNSSIDVGEKLLLRLLQSEKNAISEFELFNLAWRLSRKYSFKLETFLSYFDFGAFTAQQKYSIVSTLNLPTDGYEYIWNSLFRSDILSKRELYERCLNQPFSLQRLYSSKIHGLTTFFEYLRMATQDFARKVLILKTDDRFSVGIFMRGEVPWDEEPIVNGNVVLCSFLPQTSSSFSTYFSCTTGYRLHCSETNFQLYDKHRANTFVFLTRPPKASGAEVAASIALQKFSARVQRQLGRVNRTPVTGIELHVVSNRDRVAHQLFDLWFEHIPTELHVRRFEREVVAYRMNDVSDINWDAEDHPPLWLRDLFIPKNTENNFKALLTDLTIDQLDVVMNFGLQYHLYEEVFWTFSVIVAPTPVRRDQIIKWINSHPPLAFVLLKSYHPTVASDDPDSESGMLPPETAPLSRYILESIIRSANSLGMASLVALEKLCGTIASLNVNIYFELLWLAALSVRSSQLVQEVMFVLNDCRASSGQQESTMTDAAKNAFHYGRKHALGIAIDRAEEAADECPCDDEGKPRRQRTPPSQTRLKFFPENPFEVTATMRIDARSPIRLHSHVRLQAASKAENRWVSPIVLDGVVVQSQKGELKIHLMHPAPPETERMDWNMYNAGSIATSRAMLDALLRLMTEKSESCGFYGIITGDTEDITPPGAEPSSSATPPTAEQSQLSESLNASQIAAIDSCDSDARLSLIWGPPGTGKTTVMVQILRRMIVKQSETDGPKILMTASTHNAVDNVLERFAHLNEEIHLLREDQILRVATDLSKVNKNLQHYTIDARVGGDMNEDNKLFKKAKGRLDAARIVFTTCAGAGLGILRKADFEVALIDEASQINEPCALIPLVKGVQQAVLVGDHVQLRPTVKKIGKILEFDVSLLERLYTKASPDPGVTKTMLDVQYRFPEELARFPSQEFYESRLKSGIQDSAQVLGVLRRQTFPWPQGNDGSLIPTVFVQCSSEEDMGGLSKSNIGQVELIVDRIVPLLQKLKPAAAPNGTSPDSDKEAPNLTVTVLSPYNKQIQELKHRLGTVPCHTIDSFQGRESNIIIFSSVRCNVEADIGFVDDARRLNVMWTRPRLGLIIVGDRKTMSANALWKRAIESCTEVDLNQS